MNTKKYKIFIVSGPVHSGKTTGLIKWAQNRKDVSGILTPVINGKRFFMNAATNDSFPMEKDIQELSGFEVGKYVFSVAAFIRAKEILQNAAHQKQGWIVIDEVGPLELKGKGFHNSIREILMQRNTNLKVILVVREFLLDEVLKYFAIDAYKKFEFNSF